MTTKKKSKAKNYLRLKKYKPDILDVLMIIVGTALVSCVFTGFVLNHQYKEKKFKLDGDLVYDENINNFIKIYSEVTNNYYEEIDKEGLINSSIEGMSKFLQDKYSMYLNESSSSQFNESLESKYKGIGITVRENVIINVYKDSPAEKAGLAKDDHIIEVNSVEIKKDVKEIIEALKEENNIIKVKRKKEVLEFKVNMENIELPTVYSELIEKNEKKIGYVQITSFSTPTFEQFNNNLKELEREGIESLIIDVRSNGGGYLKSAYQISSLFSKKDSVIYKLESKKVTEEFKDKDFEERKYKIVLLIDGSSASASEVLTSSLVYNNEAITVGQKTYGKGTVQNIINNGKTTLKYTSAKWLTPNGDCIDGIGITPIYEVENELKKNVIYDHQLEKAIELLTKSNK